MKYRRRYLALPVIVFSVVFLFWLWRVLSAVISLVELSRHYSYRYPIAWALIFDFKTIFILAYVPVVLIIYFLMRNRYIRILHTKLHTWLSFAALVMLPAGITGIRSLYPLTDFPYSVVIGNVYIHDIRAFTSAVFLAIANFFLFSQ
jgi:hypothetical protein